MNTYRLWKNNRIDQEFAIGRDELKDKFTTWLGTKDLAYIEYYPTDALVRFFLTANDGMSSSFEETDFSALYEELKDRVKFAHEYFTTASK